MSSKSHFTNIARSLLLGRSSVGQESPEEGIAVVKTSPEGSDSHDVDPGSSTNEVIRMSCDASDLFDVKPSAELPDTLLEDEHVLVEHHLDADDLDTSDHPTSAQALLEVSSHIQEQEISFFTPNEECEPSMSGHLYPYNSQRLPTNSTRPVGVELKEYSFIQQCRPPRKQLEMNTYCGFGKRPQTKSRQMHTVVDGTHLPTMSCKKPRMEPLEFFPMNTEEKYALIDAVRFYPELWDDRHPNFKDTTKRSQAWNFVIVEMQESQGKDFKEEVLARSFKNLKDTYRRKVKEINDLNRKATGSEASKNVEKIKTWPFFDCMSFLDEILDQRPRFSSVCKTDEDVVVDFEESPASASSSRSRTPESGNRNGGPEKARKVSRRSRPERKIDRIASAIKSLKDFNEKMDPTKISGMKLAMTLSEMREKKPMEYAKWTMKTDEFMLEMTRALHDC